MSQPGDKSEEVVEAEYQAALRALQTTISGKTRAAPKGPNDLSWEDQFAKLGAYADRLGLRSEMENLNVIHVAGTKGKGSTCAFVEHILRENGVKTGLYTSPHLVDIRERFRVNGVPVSKQKFTQQFWWLFNKCKTECRDLGGPPAYFRFLTLLGFRIFVTEKVGCCILEVGLGGRLDATNVIRSPTVCGVTSLGLDHVEVLGDTISKIATEKAGIFKPRVPAFTSPQPLDAMEALQARAAHVGTTLEVAPPLRAYNRGASENPADCIKLGLAGAHQKLNAALAVRLVREWAFKTRPSWAHAAEAELAQGELPESFRQGLAKTEWWGRAQVVVETLGGGDGKGKGDETETREGEKTESDSSLVWYLDGAHTEESMAQCAEWFCESTCFTLPEPVFIETTESGTQTERAQAEGEGLDAGGGGDDPEKLEDAKPDPENEHTRFREEEPQAEAFLSPPPPEKKEPLRLLLFNCMEERDPMMLLTPLAKALRGKKTPLTQSFFAPSESSAKGLAPDLKQHADLRWQHKMAKVWTDLVRKHPGSFVGGVESTADTLCGGTEGRDVVGVTETSSTSATVDVSSEAVGTGLPKIPTALVAAAVPSLRLAVEKIRHVALEQRRLGTGRRVHVLVTGSLYLVGDMLRVLGRA